MIIQFTDRYDALGIRPPSSLRICGGHCEGIGYYPEDNQAEWPVGTREFGTPELDGTPDDGWRFIKCLRCNGAGKCSKKETLSRIPKWFIKCFKFVLAQRKFNTDKSQMKNMWIAIQCSFLSDLGIWSVRTGWFYEAPKYGCVEEGE